MIICGLSGLSRAFFLVFRVESLSMRCCMEVEFASFGTKPLPGDFCGKLLLAVRTIFDKRVFALCCNGCVINGVIREKTNRPSDLVLG